ncbi:MAG: FAD-binding oxidoreductase [Fibrobacterota bacterium]|nr:FAD-binding oxidoreductase [Chitinispirillaceae bacterium]
MIVLDTRSAILELATDLLSDESNVSGGIPDKVYFPESIDDLQSIFYNVQKEKNRIRLTGSHTGTTAGCIPDDHEWQISFNKMNKILSCEKYTNNTLLLTCQPGISLEALNRILDNPSLLPYSFPGMDLLTEKSYCYAPDPTEMHAQLGATVASNASGARSFRYGPTRNSIYGLTAVLPQGDSITLQNDTIINPADGFYFTDNSSRIISIPPIHFRSPDIKNAAGFYCKEAMRPMDLLIGSEGLLCAFASITILLQPKKNIIAGCTFFSSLESVFEFVTFLKKEPQVLSIELFDKSAICFINQYRRQFPGSLPEFPSGTERAILWEFGDQEPEPFTAVFDRWETALKATGSSFDNTWSGFDKSEIGKLKKFRHALPETVNATVARHKQQYNKIRKIGTDTALPDDLFQTVYQEYLRIIDDNKLPYASFGHAGNCHMHINLLPSCKDELERALDVYDQLMQMTIDAKGTVSAEHGIGRIKKKYCTGMFGEKAIDEMRLIKSAFDPYWLLNNGVMIDKKDSC